MATMDFLAWSPVQQTRGKGRVPPRTRDPPGELSPSKIRKVTRQRKESQIKPKSRKERNALLEKIYVPENGGGEGLEVPSKTYLRIFRQPEE